MRAMFDAATTNPEDYGEGLTDSDRQKAMLSISETVAARNFKRRHATIPIQSATAHETLLSYDELRDI